jgi:hypothetical protein
VKSACRNPNLRKVLGQEGSLFSLSKDVLNIPGNMNKARTCFTQAFMIVPQEVYATFVPLLALRPVSL